MPCNCKSHYNDYLKKRAEIKKKAAEKKKTTAKNKENEKSL